MSDLKVPWDMDTDSQGWTIKYEGVSKGNWVKVDDHYAEVFELRRQLWESECEACGLDTALRVETERRKDIEAVNAKLMAEFTERFRTGEVPA